MFVFTKFNQIHTFPTLNIVTIGAGPSARHLCKAVVPASLFPPAREPKKTQPSIGPSILWMEKYGMSTFIALGGLE